MSTSKPAQAFDASAAFKPKASRFTLDRRRRRPRRGGFEEPRGPVPQWMQDELDKLAAARADIEARGMTAETAGVLTCAPTT
ncbi:MAG: hypothetical protein WDM85_18250 [Caulobacteraceae bacterium]